MSPIRMSKLETAIRLVLAYQAAFNRHDLAALLQGLSEDCVLESPSPGPQGTRHAGKEAIRSYWEAYFRQQPQESREIEEVFSLGSRCVLRWCSSSGGQRGVDIFQVQEHLIREVFIYHKG